MVLRSSSSARPGEPEPGGWTTHRHVALEQLEDVVPLGIGSGVPESSRRGVSSARGAPLRGTARQDVRAGKNSVICTVAPRSEVEEVEAVSWRLAFRPRPDEPRDEEDRGGEDEPVRARVIHRCMKNSTAARLPLAMASATSRWKGDGRCTLESAKVRRSRRGAAPTRSSTAWPRGRGRRRGRGRPAMKGCSPWPSSDEVEQRVEEDPHQVDEVPVHAAELDGACSRGRSRTAASAEHHPGQHAHADEDVERVQAGR